MVPRLHRIIIHRVVDPGRHRQTEHRLATVTLLVHPTASHRAPAVPHLEETATILTDTILTVAVDVADLLRPLIAEIPIITTIDTLGTTAGNTAVVVLLLHMEVTLDIVVVQKVLLLIHRIVVEVPHLRMEVIHMDTQDEVLPREEISTPRPKIKAAKA